VRALRQAKIVNEMGIAARRQTRRSIHLRPGRAAGSIFRMRRVVPARQ